MNTKTNIFNFIGKINELENQLKRTTEELEKVKKLNAVSNALTGLNIIKEQNEARCKLISELYPQEIWGKEVNYSIDPQIVNEWIEFLEGPFNPDTIVEVKNDRLHRKKDKVFFRYSDYSLFTEQSRIIVQII